METRNKFFAEFRLIPCSILLFVISIVITGCLLIFDGYDYNIYLAVVITVLLVLLFLSSIASLIIGCIKVEISKDGISTELFGKKLKFFKWEEVSEIKASVPDKDAYVSISFYREKNKKANKIKKEKISFSYYSCDISKEALIKRYAPDSVIEKSNNSTDQ